MESQKRRVPELQDRFLAVLEHGKAVNARERLQEFDQIAALPREVRARMEDQILILENSRATTRRIYHRCCDLIGRSIVAVFMIALG